MGNVGLGSYIGFAEQVTAGTPAAPDHFLPVINMGLDADYQRLAEEHMGHPSQNNAEARETYLSAIKAGGNLKVLMGYNNDSLLLLKHCLGLLSTTGSGPSWDHEMAPSHSVPTGTAGLTVAQTYGLRGPVNRQRVFSDVAPTKWDLQWSLGKRTALNMDCVGGLVSPMQAIAGSPVFEAAPPISAYQHLSAAGLTLGGTKVNGLEDIKVSQDRKFVAPGELGSLYATTPLQDGDSDTMLELAYRWSDNTILDLFENGNYVTGAANFTDGTHGIALAFARLQVVGHPIVVSSRGLTRITARLKALGTPTNPSIKATVTTDRETL